MADFHGLSSLLNTTEGMSAAVSSRQDDNTNSLAGASWFKFNGSACNPVYISSNSFIGLNANAEQLQICRRDGQMYYLWRQDGTLWDGYYNFVKFRFEGYTAYNNADDQYRLVWELFLISDGRMLLNIIQTPTNAGYMGSSQLVCGDNNYTLGIGTYKNSVQTMELVPDDANGTAWTIHAGVNLEVPEPYARGYLIQDGAGDLYTVADGALSKIDGAEASADLFKEHGVEEMPNGALLIGLNSPKLLYWHDSTGELPVLRARITATPIVPQLITLKNRILKKAVEDICIQSDNSSLWNVSFDGGKTWKKNTSDGWAEVTEAGDGCTRNWLERVTAEGWARMIVKGTIQFRVWLTKDGFFHNIKIDYVEDAA
ncbi:MAG: hypothetical protein ACI4ET_12775 [Bilifractor sp.]